MSDWTPASFYDDGIDLPSRILRGAGWDTGAIGAWVEGVTDSASSITSSSCTASVATGNTGSFLDDGADLLHARATGGPGFGKRDSTFYRNIGESGRRDGKDGKQTYNEDVRRAVSGQIQNVLKSSWAMSRIKVREALAHEREGKERRTLGQERKEKYGKPGAQKAKRVAAGSG